MCCAYSHFIKIKSWTAKKNNNNNNSRRTLPRGHPSRTQSFNLLTWPTVSSLRYEGLMDALPLRDSFWASLLEGGGELAGCGGFVGRKRKLSEQTGHILESLIFFSINVYEVCTMCQALSCVLMRYQWLKQWSSLLFLELSFWCGELDKHWTEYVGCVVCWKVVSAMEKKKK